MGCMPVFFQLFNPRQTSTGNKLHADVDHEVKKKSRISTFIGRLTCLKSHSNTVAPVFESEKWESPKPHSEAPSSELAHTLSFSDWKQRTCVVPEDDFQTEEFECFSFRVTNGELIKGDNKFVELSLSDLKEATFVVAEDDCQSELCECFSFRVINGELIKDDNKSVELSSSDLKEGTFVVVEEDDCQSEVCDECFSYRVIKEGNEFVELLETDDYKIKKIVTPPIKNIEHGLAFSTWTSKGDPNVDKLAIQDANIREILRRLNFDVQELKNLHTIVQELNRKPEIMTNDESEVLREAEATILELLRS